MPDTTISSDNDFIRNSYISLLAREPDEGGRRAFLLRLSQGRLTRQAMLDEILCSSEYASLSRQSASSETPAGCTRTEAMAVFEQFYRSGLQGRAAFVTNFMGCVTETAVSHLLAELSGRIEAYPIPGNFHGETLEWIGTLRAALDCGDTFSMIELGAGWGPWCVIGAMAAKKRNNCKVKVVGIEADSGHVRFMERNFAANGLGPDEAEALHGAIGIQNGTAYFPKAEKANEVYGGAAAYSAEAKQCGPFADFMRGNDDLVQSVEAVPCFALVDQITKLGIVDLVHCDIQGTESELIPASIDVLTAKVKRLIVGTHSFEIDRKLASAIGAAGWACEGVSACQMQDEGLLIADGMQVWRNPAFF